MGTHSRPFDTFRDLAARSRAAAEVRVFKSNVGSIGDLAADLDAALAGSGWRVVTSPETEAGMGGFFLARFDADDRASTDERA